MPLFHETRPSSSSFFFLDPENIYPSSDKSQNRARFAQTHDVAIRRNCIFRSNEERSRRGNIIATDVGYVTRKIDSKEASSV